MKKLFILTLAVLSFIACNQATKPAQQAITLPALHEVDNNFVEQMNNKTMVIAFMAGFCGYCKAMFPYMDELAKQVPANQADVVAAFIDEQPEGLLELEPIKNAKNIKIYYNAGDLMQEQGIRGFPTIMLFKNGELIDTWRGYSPDHVESILEALKNLK